MLIKIILLILITVFAFAYLKYFERRSIYFPSSVIEITPENIGLIYEDIEITTKDGVVLSAWFIPKDAAYATLIFCHGNGGNISHRLDKIRIFHNLGLNVLIFDYRGYGKSGGSPSEAGLYRDTEAAYEYLVNTKKIPADKIVVFGESLGSAPAIDLLSKNNAAALIVEGGFSSARDMAKRIYPLIPTFIYTIRFNSLAKIKDVKAPKLFFHSRSDEVVPFDLGMKLFEQAGEPKEFIAIFGAHNIAFLDSEELVVKAINRFLKGLNKF